MKARVCIRDSPVSSEGLSHVVGLPAQKQQPQPCYIEVEGPKGVKLLFDVEAALEKTVSYWITSTPSVQRFTQQYKKDFIDSVRSRIANMLSDMMLVKKDVL